MIVQSIFQYYFCSVQFVNFAYVNDLKRLRTDVCSSSTGSALILSQNYSCNLTSTLYKPGTSLRRTAGVGPDGIRLRESSLHRVTVLKITRKTKREDAKFSASWRAFVSISILRLIFFFFFFFFIYYKHITLHLANETRHLHCGGYIINIDV